MDKSEIRSTNDESMTKFIRLRRARMTNPDKSGRWLFVIGYSGLIRHSDFVIRHYQRPTHPFDFAQGTPDPLPLKGERESCWNGEPDGFYRARQSLIRDKGAVEKPGCVR